MDHGEAVNQRAAQRARQHAFDRCRTAFESCRAAFASLEEAHRLDGPRSPRYRLALATWRATLAEHSELRVLARELM